MNPASTAPGRRAAFGFIFACALMNAVSFGIMIPVLPNLIKQFMGGDTAAAAQWTVLFASVWGIMQLVCGPVLGMLSDRFGRRPVLLISLAGLAVDFMIMALAPNLAWLFAGRVSPSRARRPPAGSTSPPRRCSRASASPSPACRA